MCMDAATEFNSEPFLNFLQKHGVKPRVIATDAHWQNSRAEKHGGILQEILKRMDIEESINTYEQLEISWLLQLTQRTNGVVFGDSHQRCLCLESRNVMQHPTFLILA